MRNILLVACLLLVVSACRTEYLEKPLSDFWLELTLASSSVEAGEHVEYQLHVVGLEGSREPVAPAMVTSSVENDLYYTTGRLFPTVAGSHGIEATATWEGEELQASAELQVVTGPPARLDLQLSDHATQAGDPVDWHVDAWDRQGNPLDTTEVVVEADNDELEVELSTLRSLVPGTYSVTATIEGVSDTETLLVLTGTAASVELTLSTTDIEVYETTSATVVVRDAHGNVTDDPWVLSVEGHSGADPAVVAISHSNLTFMDEGIFSVHATVEVPSGAPLVDTVGPLLVDSSGPVISMFHPPRGAWNDGYTGTVSGNAFDLWSGVSHLEVNGVSATPDGAGDFALDMTYDFSLNLLETIAVDGDANASQDIRSLLAGQFMSYGSSVSEGIFARINQGGFDTLATLGAGMVNSSDLTAYIPSPVYSASQDYCWSTWFGTFCYTLYSINLYVTNPSFSTSTLSLDPRSGYVRAVFTVYDPYLNWSASGVISEIGYSGSGYIKANSIQISMNLVPRVSGGQIYVDVSGVSVNSTGFDFNFDSWIYTVVEWFGFDVDSVIQGYIEDALEDAITDEVPAMLEDVLQDLEMASTFDLGGVTYDLDAEPSSVSVDDDGLSLGLATWFTTRTWDSPYTGLGSLYYGYSTPSYGAAPGMVLSLSDDFVNQLLFAFWGGGVLDMAMDDDELGLDVESLAFLFPDMESVTLVTSALLPPVVVPGTGTSMLDLQLGDYEISIYGGEPSDDTLVLQAYMHIFGGLDLGVSGDATLAPSLGDVDVVFDVVHPAANTLAAADTRDLLEALVPLFLPFITDALAEIPIPEIQGFTLSGVSVSLSGAESGYVDLGGDLVAR